MTGHRDLVDIPLADIDPFDPTHIRVDADPGFVAIGEEPGAHFEGARRCAALLGAGIAVRPIAVCRAELVPVERRNGSSDRPWQRLDGFKRYWGHVLAGRETIRCMVIEDYLPGAQHGMSMTEQ